MALIGPHLLGLAVLVDDVDGRPVALGHGVGRGDERRPVDDALVGAGRLGGADIVLVEDVEGHAAGDRRGSCRARYRRTWPVPWHRPAGRASAHGRPPGPESVVSSREFSLFVLTGCGPPQPASPGACEHAKSWNYSPAVRRSGAPPACLKRRGGCAIGTPPAGHRAGNRANGGCGRIDGGQARPGHGRRQPSFDRLGHRPGVPEGRRGARPDLPGRPAQEARRAAGRRNRRRGRRPLRRDRHGDRRCGLRPGARHVGRARFRRPRHRLLRPRAAHRPLRRHDGGQLLPHHAHLLLLADGRRPAGAAR